MSSPSVHAMAQSGFGSANDLYDRARPSYQPVALSRIRNSVRGSPPYNVVEVGSGTGIFTRALLAHPEWSTSVREIRAFEPSAGMRDVFSKTVKDERASIFEGTFNQIGVEDGWADLVVIAQAFHWCPDFEGAALEFARVLKPGGIVALIWNLEDRDRARWVAQLRDSIEKYEEGSPQFRLGLWRQFFSAPSYSQLFEPQEEKNFSHALPGTVPLAVERACSKSYISVLPDDKKSKVISDVKAALDRGDDMVWIDKDQGIFEYPYNTLVVVSRKK